MRRITHIGVAFILAMMLLQACGGTRSAAEKQKLAADITLGVETPDFTFKARHAYPTGYRSVYLSPYYDVKVQADTVKAYLPYYGRAYRAPMDPREGGYRFTSTDFEYSAQPGKRQGNWEVVIRINDVDRPVTFRFDIWDSGSARLDVTDVDRQQISFQGEVVVNNE